jgi:hypothetical protein
MSFRCINAFAFQNQVYGNGLQVEDDAAILKTHRDHFAQVEQNFTARAVEQAEAKPEGLRATTKPAAKPEAKKAVPAPASPPTPKPAPKPAPKPESGEGA